MFWTYRLLPNSSHNQFGQSIVTQPLNPDASSSASIDLFKTAYLKSPSEKVEEIKRGIPAHRIGSLALEMSVSQTSLLNAMGLSRATVHHKANKMALLSKSESALVLGVETLIGQVQVMVAESGDGSAFDPAKWIGRWIASPNATLGGEPPSFYMDTVEGQKLVAQVLAMTQSAAYG